MQSVKVIPDGPMYFLDAYQWENQPRQWLTVGAASDLDIVVDDPTVSELHCLLQRERDTGRLYVQDADSKNGVLVNGTLLHHGKVELSSGSLLSLGGAILLACGHKGAEQRPVVSGQTLHEILERAIAAYGSQRKAARALKVKQRTYCRWVEEQKFK